METMGLPTDIEAYFADGFPLSGVRDRIKRELLGPGIGDDGYPNDYGVALRSALDALAYREDQLPLPPDQEALLGRIRDRLERIHDAEEAFVRIAPRSALGWGIASELLEYLEESEGLTQRDVNVWLVDRLRPDDG